MRALRKLGVIAAAYAIFWVSYSGNAWGPFANFGDCQQWASANQMFNGSCQYRTY
jgi:hypothetical protein